MSTAAWWRADWSAPAETGAARVAPSPPSNSAPSRLGPARTCRRSGDGGRVVVPRIHQRKADAAKHANWRDGQRLTSEEDLDARDRRLIELGVSRDVLARSYGIPAEQVGKPRITKASIAKELAAIDKLRREDRRGYNADVGLQKRERELIVLRDKLAAKPAKSESRTEGDASFPQDVLAEWAEQGGTEHHLKVAQRTVEAITDELGDDEADEFDASFGALPASVQSAVYRFIGVDGGGASGLPATTRSRSSPTPRRKPPSSSSPGAARPPSAWALHRVASN